MKTWFFLGLLAYGFIDLASSLLDRQGLLWSCVLVVSLATYIYSLNATRFLKRNRPQLLEGQDGWGLTKACQDLCARARVPIPKIYLINSPTPYCLSFGTRFNASSIFITRGLLDQMKFSEVRAALAHEIARIKTGDIFALTTTTLFARWILCLSSWAEYSNSNVLKWVKNALNVVLFPMASLVIRCCLSHKNYYQVDKIAAHLVGDSRQVAEVLWKLSCFAHTYPAQIPLAKGHLFIVNPLTNRIWNRYFQAHPPIEKRVRNLIGYFPV